MSATPYDTTDSAGRKLGFNDPISIEHYRIILMNLVRSRPGDWKEGFDLYTSLCLLAQMGAIGLLWSRRHRHKRSVRWYFVLQSVLFPVGWIVLLLAPQLLAHYTQRILTGRLDREDVIDIPFVWLVSQVVWVLAATAIAIAKPGESLGLKLAWTWFKARCQRAVAAILPAH
jgi:hypothetical protein